MYFLFIIFPFSLIIGLQEFFRSVRRNLSTSLEHRTQRVFVTFSPRTAGILPKTSPIRKETSLVCELSDAGKTDVTGTSVGTSLARSRDSPSDDCTHLTLPGSGGFPARGQVLRKEVRELRAGRRLTGSAHFSRISNTFSGKFIVSELGALSFFSFSDVMSRLYTRL